MEKRLTVLLLGATDDEVLEIADRLDSIPLDFDFGPASLGGAFFIVFLTREEEARLKQDPLLNFIFYGGKDGSLFRKSS